MCIDGKGEKKKNREQIWIKYSVSLIQPPHLWRLVSSYASEEIVSTSCWDKPENFAISSIVNLFDCSILLAVSIAAWFCPSENPDSRPSENPVSCPDFSPSEKPASYSAFRNFFSSNSLSYSKILILITSARFLERNSARIPSFMHSSTAHSTA